MSQPTVTVLIPTYNMAAFLEPLWHSIRDSGLARAVDQVLFVNDGSTDETTAVLERLSREPTEDAAKLRAFTLRQNSGRFRARYLGALEVKTERILFLDSRLTLPSNFGEALTQVNRSHENVVGHVDIDTDRSVFCLYWDRSHRAIFRKYFRDTRDIVTLTPENYDQYLKGTGVFLCSTGLFVAASSKFADQDLKSDDTYLMFEMVKQSPIVIHPALRIQWVPRETAGAFLARLWERGPGFVEYHVFQQRGAFFWIVMAGLLVLTGWLALMIHDPGTGLRVLGGILLAILLSTAVFAKGPGEFFRMAPLHLAVVLTYGLGVLRGIVVNLGRVFATRRGDHRKA